VCFSTRNGTSLTRVRKHTLRRTKHLAANMPTPPSIPSVLESSDPRFEFFNYYGNTSLFALDVLRRHGNLPQMKLLSIASRMPHLADYLGLFHTVHHNTMVQTSLPLAAELCPAKLVMHQCDLFELPPLEVDCVISHAAIHCMNDTRYGNASSPDGWQKPYRAATKIRQIIGDKPTPAIVSISVNRDEGFFENNTHLSHEKFIRSFESAGFHLQEYFFDYLCGGIPQKPLYMQHEYRRSKTLPEASDSPRTWVVGNYYFL
jgi:hypothetical protein